MLALTSKHVERGSTQELFAHDTVINSAHTRALLLTGLVALLLVVLGVGDRGTKGCNERGKGWGMRGKATCEGGERVDEEGLQGKAIHKI